MELSTLYHLSLVTHICGITLLAGLTAAEWIMIGQVFRQAKNNLATAVSMRAAMAKFPMLSGIGFLLLILSGVSMMAITHGAFGEQTWFRVKFGLILLIIVNGLAIGRKLNKRLKNVLAGTPDPDVLKPIQRNTNAFYGAQTVFFLAIFILSVFKFN